MARYEPCDEVTRSRWTAMSTMARMAATTRLRSWLLRTELAPATEARTAVLGDAQSTPTHIPQSVSPGWADRYQDMKVRMGSYVVEVDQLGGRARCFLVRTNCRWSVICIVTIQQTQWCVTTKVRGEREQRGGWED